MIAQIHHINWIYSITWLCLLLLEPLGLLQAQDLPNPSTNIQTIAAGSYVIPLDEQKQLTSYSYPMSSGDSIIVINYEALNLKAYGLAHELLEKGVYVKWIIRSGKNKDEADFTANAYQVFPTTTAPSDLSFYSSAFVIDLNNNQYNISCNPTYNDTPPEIDDIITEFGNEVAVYKLSNDEQLDVRYELKEAPRISILNDGYDTWPHKQILELAAIPYQDISNEEFLNSSQCNTFVSQPHIDIELVNETYANTVASFVSNGGNFLAQCVGLLAFENTGFYQSTNGFVNIGGGVDGNNYTFLHNDLAIMQFQGNLPPNIYGTTGSYGLEASSTWRANSYPTVIVGNDPQANEVLVSGADINGSDIGGNMFYLGGHEYSTTLITTSNAEPQIIQAQRTYLNAAFIPGNVAYTCTGPDVCICLGESVSLGCANLSDNIAYSWSPADGLSCTNCPNPIASPTTTTTYTMTANSNSCGSSNITVTVNKILPEIENVVVNCVPDGTGYTVSFDLIDGNEASYLVLGNEGTISGNQFVSNPINNGQTYEFTATDVYNCGNTITGTFDCSDCPHAILNGDAAFCNDGINTAELNLTITGSPPWEIVYAIDYIAQAPIITNTSPHTIYTTTVGTYTLLSVSNSFCTGTTTGTAEVTAANPTFGGSASNRNICKNEDAFRLNSLLTAGVDTNGIWTPPLANQNNLFDPSQDTTNSYTYTLSAEAPCPDIVLNFDITVLENVDASINPVPVICKGDGPYSLAATDVGGVWAGNGIVDANAGIFDAALVTDGVHTVSYEIAGLCGDIDYVDIHVKTVPEVALVADMDACLGKAVSMEAYVKGSSFEWHDGDTEREQLTTINDGIYWIQAHNECGVARDSLVINFKNCLGCQLVLPTSFSPNKDGYNDSFRSILSCDVVSYELQIFNRWGANIFTSNAPHITWDGTYKGKEAEVGVYVYMLRFQYVDEDGVISELEQHKGHVTIIR